MNYSLSEFSKIIDAEIIGNCQEKNIQNIIFDSRKVISSDIAVFFAFETSKNDGHKYIEELINKGIKIFVVHKKFTFFENHKNCCFLIVNNTIEALHKLAVYHRKKFDIPVIAVTGSNGKTIVKEWFTSIASDFSKILQSPKSYNSQLGVPLSVLELDKFFEIAFFEAGISKMGEMSKIEKIIQPKIGIITNIGDAHQENFDYIEQKLNEKIQLFKNAEIIIYNKDNSLIDKTLALSYPFKQKFTFGLSENSDLIVKKIYKNHLQTNICLKYQNIEYDFSINFIDDASIENALTVLSALLVVYKDKTPNSFDLSNLYQIKMRLQQIEGMNNCTIINDSYNSDLSSLKIAIDVLNAQQQHSKKTIILSDLNEVGKDERTIYQTVANLVKYSNIDRIFGIGQKISKFADLFKIPKSFYPDTHSFILDLFQQKFNNETILVKGARNFKFEKITKELQLKNHRTVLEINLNNFEHNYQYFRELLKPETKIMVMVKAFSYGSGSYEIANFLQLKNVDYLAVAIADEGIELRKAGIKTPILILNPDTDNIEIFKTYSLEPEIYNFRMLEIFSKKIGNIKNEKFPVHIKINTGMNRLGFSEDDIEKLITFFKQNNNLFIKSAFSHLVGSSDSKFDDFTINQAKLFEKITSVLKKELSYNFIKHIANSSAIERFPDFHLDMVRLGIGLYGISSSTKNFLKNISTLKTRIIQINNVKKGDSVGYDRTWFAQKDSKIATLPIGYADGLSRKLSNGVGKVKINNSFAPIVGNICMDLTMIDITEIDAGEGDEVIIFDEEYTVSDIAKLLGTIPYEVLTSISQRIKRVYVWE